MTRDFSGRLVGDHGLDAASIEQYRSLALELQRSAPKGRGRAILVTSAVPAEGKSLTAANLALTFSRSYRRSTLLIDADLRRPALTGMFPSATPELRKDLGKGLPRELVGPRNFAQVDENLLLLALADRPVADPVSVLTAPAMSRLLDWARGLFDWVLLDSPPAALVPDPNILAAKADGVLLVVHAASTRADVIRHAVAGLGHEQIVGVVLNRIAPDVDDNPLQYYGYYDRYYANDAPQPPAGRGLDLR